MQTEQELEEEKKAIERDGQLEAAKPWYARAWDTYQDHRERHPWWAPIIGFALLIVSAIVAVKC